LLVPGGTFYRSYDGVDFTDMSYPATVDDFYLDKYEITVGRFRRFVNAGMGTQASPPPSGAGAHPGITGSGWDSTWNANLPKDTASLKATIVCPTVAYQNETWTDTPASNEDEPMNCIDWYTAFAFCAWDGGRLPTEAEWNYAAAGGSEQRYYPWSSPPTSTAIDISYAAYCDDASVKAGACLPRNVGSRSPKGDGKWGHADLGGNLWEWALDWYVAVYPTPCRDCANLIVSGSFGLYFPRVLRGGGFHDGATGLRSAERIYDLPGPDVTGARCARTSL
jgi:formylglycine-generating enzyme required for sulfatase activity